MSISELQKSLQIADDLDEQATRLNIYIADPDIPKKDRLAAAETQSMLRQHAADLRVNMIQDLVDEAAPGIDQIMSAIANAKSAANKINHIKQSLDLAAASIALFAAIASKQPKQIVASFSNLKKATEAGDNA